MDKITVCIPVYNEEKYIGNCIKSLLNQTYNDWNLIILDNCSTDNTAEIIKKIKDNRITYIRNEYNIGAGNNMNKCFEICDTRYLLVLKADDLIAATMLEESIKIFKSYPELAFVYSDFEDIDDEGNNLGAFFKKAANDILYRQFEYIMQSKDCTLSNALINMEYIKSNIDIKFYDEKIGGGSDLAYWDYIDLCGGKIYYLNKILYFRRRRKNCASESLYADGSLYFSAIKRNNLFMKKIQNMELTANEYNKLCIRYKNEIQIYIIMLFKQHFYNEDIIISAYQEILKCNWIDRAEIEIIYFLIYFKLNNRLDVSQLFDKLVLKGLCENQYYKNWDNIFKNQKRISEIFKRYENIAIYGYRINGNLIKKMLSNNNICITNFIDGRKLNISEVIIPTTENINKFDAIIIPNESEKEMLEVHDELINLSCKAKIFYWNMLLE